MSVICSGQCSSLAIVVCLVFASNSRADVLVSNLAEPYRASTPIGNGPIEEYWAAQSFVTDGNAWNLDSIQAIMGNETNSPAGLFELRRDTAANTIDLTAGGLVASFTAPWLAGANSVRDFFPTSGTTLDPNSRYWFVTGVTNGGTFEWDYANTGTFTGPGALTEFGESADSGTMRSYHDSPFFPYYMQVNGSPVSVPEPATGLMGLRASRSPVPVFVDVVRLISCMKE